MRLKIVPLDPKAHDRGAFSCGNEAIDRYLRMTAAQAAQFFKSGTFVLVAEDGSREILGFYTLSQHGYRDGEIDATTAKFLKIDKLRVIPMILLGQLGISQEHQNKGLGKMLLWNSFERSFAISQAAGGVALITDPYDDAARQFYEKFDFQLLHEKPYLRLILAMRTIAEALKAQTDCKK